MNTLKTFKMNYILMGDENTYVTYIKATDWQEARKLLREKLGLKTVSDLAYLYDREITNKEIAELC